MLIAWFGIVNGWGILGILLSAAVLHEGGHWLALWLLGARPTGFRVGICGAVLTADTTALSYGGELVAVLAGPAVNLLCALVLARLGQSEAAGAHLSLGVFNLLPVRPLDGGRTLGLCLDWLLGPTLGDGITRAIGAITALLLAGLLAAVMEVSGGSLWLLPAFCGMLGASFREIRGFFPRKAAGF